MTTSTVVKTLSEKVTVLPLNCKCQAGTWGGEPYSICSEYIPSEEGYCETCSHDKACHIEDGTQDELEFLRSENVRLRSDLEIVTGKPSLNNLIPEILSSIKSCNISGTTALKLSTLPHELQSIFYGYIRLTWQLQSQIEDLEDKMSQMKKLLISF